MNTEKIGFSANKLKYFAIVAVLIDHIAWRFVPLDSPLGITMHIIGRMAAPIMSYFVAEGFYHTSNIKKYILRMGIFAVISCPAYLFMKGILYYDNGLKIESYNYIPQSVMYTFFISLLLLSVKSRNYCGSRLCLINKALLYVSLFACSLIGDWAIIVPAWVLVFHTYRGNFKKLAFVYAILSIVLITIIYKETPFLYYQYAVLLALIPLRFYNGKRAENCNNQFINKFNKWIFYIFYPLHMILIGLFVNL